MTLHLREIDSEGFILDGHLSVSNTSELSAINISDNSFWMGDETLVSLSGGKIKFKKRNKSIVPPAILQAGAEAGHVSHQVTTDAALAHAGVATIEAMTLSHWYKYFRTLKGDDTPSLHEVFSSYTDDDFEETRIGIGVADPTEALDVSGNINFSGTLKQGGNPFVSTPWTIQSNPAALSYAAGNIAIGGTNPNAAKLHIGPFDDDHLYLASANNDYGWKFDTADYTNGAVPFRIKKRTGGAETTVLTIKNENGYVGIGSEPSNLFHIYKAADEGTSGLLIEKAQGGTGAAALFFGVNNTNENPGVAKAAIFYERNAFNGRGDIKFCNNHADDPSPVTTEAVHTKMIIKNDGKIGLGIGEVNPTAQLTVSSIVGSSDNAIPAANMGENTAFPPTTHLWLANKHDAYNPYWGLAIGTTWEGASYIQNLNKKTNTYYNLLLQPNGGNVGVGTTTPSGTLELSSTRTGLSGLTTNEATLMISCTDASAADDGDIGGGVVFRQRWNNPNATLVPTGGIYGYKDRNSGSYGGGLLFTCCPNDGIGGVLTEVMRLTKEGNVGVNTLTPNTKLHVHNSDDSTGTGDAFISGVTANTENRKPTECLRLQGQWRSSGSGALLRFTNSHGGGANPNTGEYNTAAIAGLDYANNWGGALCFYTAPTTSGGGNLTPRMILDPYGNVGVAANLPTEKLHIKDGNIRLDGTGYIRIQNKHDTSDYGSLELSSGYRGAASRPRITISGYTGANTVHGDNVIKFDTNGSQRMIVNQSGDIGVGTTSPSGKLHVSGGRQYLTMNRHAFSGLDAPSGASGRAQFVMSSYYSDLVIASQENNSNGHGSTISFTNINPNDNNDYRKFVIGQGNYYTDDRRHKLYFGYKDEPVPNPHMNHGENTYWTHNVMVLNGRTKQADFNGRVVGRHASGFVANNTTSGDGDNWTASSLENDYSAWSSIFKDDWLGTGTGWGTFWAGNYQAKYRRIGGDGNPNEYVMVGYGTKRFTFDLDVGGYAYFDGALRENNYDYAEYFEWEDGNLEDEDRRGYSVVLGNEGKIKKATHEDDSKDIIGVVSGTSGIIGDAACYDWQGKYEIDEWGTRITDEVYQLTWSEVLEDGKKKNYSYDEDRVPDDVTVPEEGVSKRLHHRYRITQEYDESQEYIPRDKRKEWCPVGLLGKVRVRDDCPKNTNWRYLKTIAGKELWLIR